MTYQSDIKRSECEFVLVRWMKLEPIIQSEVSQRKKLHNNMCVYTHIYICISISYKNVTDKPICRAGIETQIQRTYLWT